MKKEQVKDKVIRCFECEKEKDGWCYLFERLVYPQNFCDFAVPKAKVEKEKIHDHI